MTTDNGNGMKIVGVIILFSLFMFISGLFMAWVNNTFMHPAWSSASYPASSRR